MCPPYVLKAIVLAVAAVSCSAIADDANQQSIQASGVEAAQVLDINIPAMPLSSALSSLAQRAGKVISFEPAVTKGKTSAAIKGQYSFEQALQRLLQQTGLTAAKKTNGGYVIQGAMSGTQSLAPVEVVGRRLGQTEGTGSYTTGSMNTAAGMNLSIRETPQSVSVISSQLIADQNVRTLQDAMALTPGVNVTTDGPGFSTFFIRGHEVDTVQLDGQTMQVITEADRYLLSTFNAASVDRFEVVRGAAGLTAGSGNPAGVVNIVRKRGGDEFAGSLSASVGNYETHSTTVDLGGPLNDSASVRGRFVASYEDQQDHIKGYYSKNRPALYAALDADLSEATTLSLLLDYQEINGDGLADYAPVWRADDNLIPFNPQPSRSFSTSPAWEKADQERDAISLNLNHRFDNEWNLLAAYTRRNGRYHYEYLTSIGRPTAAGDYLGEATRLMEDVDTDIFNLKLNGDFELFGKQHQFVVGYNYSQQKSSDSYDIEGVNGTYSAFRNLNFNTINPGTEPYVAGWEKFTENDYKTTQSAVYANSQWQVTDPLSLLLGFRLSDYKQDQTQRLFYDSSFNAISTPRVQDGSDYDHDNVFVPYAGLVYDFNDQVSGYASYTEIFKVQSNSVRDINGDLLDPVESKNYEVGVKGEFFEGDLNATIALFELKQQNVAERAGTFPAGSSLNRLYGDYYRGISGRKTTGIELGISGNLTDNWQVMGGYTHQSFKNADGTTDTSKPENIVKLSTRYQFTGDLQKLAIGGSYHWQSDAGFAAFPADHSDKFALVDLWGSYQFTNDLSARLNIHNALDETYVDTVAGYANYGEARRIHLTLDYDF